MGNGGSSLVDCVQDCDTQELKQQLATRVADVEDGELADAELHCELEDAVHTALSMEITSPHQYQQLQIALELLLQLAPTALQTSECNNAEWTALHRACVTSNLAFVAFLFHRYPQYMTMDRDAFGLLPLDLVPPEISFIGAKTQPVRMTTERAELVKALPSTERERIELALDVLRQCKTDAQQRTVRHYLSGSVELSNQQYASDCTTLEEEEPFFVAFEPSRGQLSHEIAGIVHQIDLPLCVRYHLPREESFVHGYFQLIWRTDDHPRSEEPNYEHHVLLRESLDLDHAAPRSEDLEANQRETRRLHDQHSDKASATLTGSVAMDVAHLPEEAVCHVLFVASDKQLMKREIVLSTEGVRLVRLDLLNANVASSYEPYEEPPFEYEVDSDGEADIDGFVFHVAGEAFKHPSEELAGREFDSVDEFEEFVKDLRAAKKQQKISADDPNCVGEQTKEVGAAGKDHSVRRPTVLSNQDEDQELGTEDDELVLVEASKDLEVDNRKAADDEKTEDNQHDDIA